jgi:hypothetical protein
MRAPIGHYKLQAEKILLDAFITVKITPKVLPRVLILIYNLEFVLSIAAFNPLARSSGLPTAQKCIMNNRGESVII